MDEVRIDGYCSVYCRDLAEVRKDTLSEAAEVVRDFDIMVVWIEHHKKNPTKNISDREILAQAILNLENNK